MDELYKLGSGAHVGPEVARNSNALLEKAFSGPSLGKEGHSIFFKSWEHQFQVGNTPNSISGWKNHLKCLIYKYW